MATLHRTTQAKTTKHDPRNDDVKEILLMAKLTKDTMFKAAQPRNETAMEKTARAVKEITDADTKQRQDKMARLRKARHESEADTSVKTTATNAK